MINKLNSVSLVLPIYNEEGGIEEYINACLKEIKTLSFINDFEIILINDGSTDNTLSIIKKFSNNKHIKIINFKKNLGVGCAFREGIKKTKLEWVLTSDSDGQFHYSNISKIITYASKIDSKIISGARIKKGAYSHILGSKFSTLLCNMIHKSNLKDFNSSFKLIYGSIVRDLKMNTERMNFSTEITSRILENNYQIKEIDVLHIERKFGLSSSKIFSTGISRILFIIYIFCRITKKKIKSLF